MKMNLPEDVKLIIDVLEKSGKEAFAVGGCVRDLFLMRTPKDWDVTTSAKPMDVKAAFRKTIDTGIKHGTVTVMLHNVGYEVTTYRLDGKYTDSRHPESVEFTSDLREDLRRRDFTINAMAYNDRAGVVDLFEGQKDLERKVVRAVGDPLERFTEDALRIMRCIRFAAELKFSIDPETYEAAKKLSPRLKNISKERIRDEFVKILRSDHPEYLLKLWEIGAIEEMIPGFSEKETAVYDWIRVLPKEEHLRLSALLSVMRNDLQVAAEDADRILKDLRFDNETKNKAVHLIRALACPVCQDAREFRHMLSQISKEAFMDYYLLLQGKARDCDREMLDFYKRTYDEIMEKGICVSVKELAVTGNDLIAAGIKPGKQMGALLQQLLLMVLDCPEKNQKDILLAEVLKSV